MKKSLSVFVLIVLVLFSVSMLPGNAIAADGHGGGGHGWGHGGGGHGWGHGGGHGWGWGYGWGPWWGPWWGYGWGSAYYPYYPNYPYYPYYDAPATVYQQQPAYEEATPRQVEQSYWYFCTKPQGYYPYVKKCPSGWLKVVPSSAPPDQEMNSAPYPDLPDQRR
jgi:hypothetical protein